MTNETNVAPAPAIGPGARLKTEREAQQQSIEQAARHLRLDTPTVAAIEADQYPAHVPGTFMRGYLRAYAKWLDLPADEIVAAYNTRHPDEATLAGLKTLLPLPESGRSGGGKWLLGTLTVLLAVVFVGAIVLFMPGDWWKQMTASTASTETAGPTSVEPEPAAVTSGELTLQLAPEEPLPAAVDAEVPAEPAAKPAAVAGSVAPPASSTASKPETTVSAPVPDIVTAAGEVLEFVFDEDCWIRVTDSSGAVLSVGIKENGQRIRLSGAGPLTVVLGNPAGVELKHNGRPVDLSGYPSERPATLTIKPLVNE